MSLYGRRLETDLAHWRAQGWVSEDGARAILADHAARHPGVRLTDILALLGAALLCLAAASFVAANWAEIPRPAKLGLLVALLWAAYGAAAAFAARGMEIAAHAATLVGVGLFGADVMLIAQMYHIGGAPTGLLLVWMLGALGAGLALRSPPALVAAAALALLWSEYYSMRSGAPHWPALLAYGAIGLAFWRSGWRGGFHVLAAPLAWFAIALSVRLSGGSEPAFALTAVLGLAAMAAGVALDHDERRRVSAAAAGGGRWFAERGRALTVYGFIVAFAGVFGWQIEEGLLRDGLAEFAPYAAVGLGFLLGVLVLAARRGHATLLWWCYGALVVQLAMIYLRTLGTLLETALFFLLAAGVVIGMAWIAARLSRDAARKRESAS